MSLQLWRPGWGIRTWSPFENMEQMQRRFEDMFGREMVLPSFWKGTASEEGAWMPPIEMVEKDDKFIVKAELPGMKKEEIDVQIIGNNLTIKGERKSETKEEKENYYLSEHSYGSFFRSISVPSSVNVKNIEASYNDGILEVVLPKAPEAKAKKVEVAVK